MDLMSSIIERFIVERNKKVDSTILGEIQKISTENGIETKIILNEKAVADALRKQIPKKPKITLHGTTDYNTKCTCPSCGGFVCTDKYCRNCGQALDWGR